MADLTTLAAVKAWLALQGKPISAITRANPGVVTVNGHGLQSNAQVTFSGLNGMTELNGQIATITVLDANTFSIGIDTSAYGDYVNGGFLGADDVLLQTTITSVSAALERMLSRTFAATTYNEMRNGNGKSALMVLNDPILSVTSVTVNGVAIPARPTFNGRGYTFDEDTIYLDSDCFERGRQNVQLVYEGGFDPLPVDLVQDAAEAVAFLYRERDRVGLAAKAMEGATTSYLRDLPPHLMRRFNQYQRTVRPPV